MQVKEETTVNIKKPSRILHFSDGILEVFDDDNELKVETKEEIIEVDETQLGWTPWFLFKAQRLGKNVVSGLDYTGEKIADFLNITSPKYAYEINQYKKEMARRAAEDETTKQNTWTVDPPAMSPITTPPTQSNDPKF